MRPRIVTIGGGNGQSELLRALRGVDAYVTAIVTVMDSGGSSGILRKDRGIPAVGDVRRCLAALIGPEQEQEWNGRDTDGHALGNLIIADEIQKKKSMTTALASLGHALGATGTVLPVTEEPVDLCAELMSHEIIIGEGVIDAPDVSIAGTLARMYLEPVAHVTREVVDAVRAADCIVLTMGDLYTSIVPNLLVQGVVHALEGRKATSTLVYVCNRSTKSGETDGFSVADYVDELHRYIQPVTLDVVLFDSSSVVVPAGYERVKDNDQLSDSLRIIRDDFVDDTATQFVSGEKVAQTLLTLCTS